MHGLAERAGRRNRCLSTMLYMYATVRLKIIGNEMIKNVGKYQSRMVYQ